MQELSRQGHRQRVKESYLKNSVDSMPDHNLLELILFYAIPQKDVKPLAYELINHFGSLENVFKADIEELVRVKGVKEHTAILISLFREVNQRINQNTAREKLNSFEKIEEYASYALRDYTKEVFMVVTLANDKSIINTRILEGDSVNETSVTKKQIAEILIRDNASAMVIAHNHPGGNTTPSSADINMTQELSRFLRQLGSKLFDHIIVGKNGETQSIKGDLKYALYFDDTAY